MTKMILTMLAAVALCAAPAWSDVAEELLVLERRGMNGWLSGDPEPQLALYDPRITYFHEITTTLLEGFPAVKEMYDRYRSRPLFYSYRILDTQVRSVGDGAV